MLRHWQEIFNHSLKFILSQFFCIIRYMLHINLNKVKKNRIEQQLNNFFFSCFVFYINIFLSCLSMIFWFCIINKRQTHILNVGKKTYTLNVFSISIFQQKTTCILFCESFFKNTLHIDLLFHLYILNLKKRIMFD